ncbi:hypothetical protein GALL_173910 [mine drainage metagenome]|uniref:Uncharacterized protein n=1 Tax=mine drainage metagenome TaxID=410659 RepID=A0A1J5SK97_9ZZZZ
MNPVRRAVVNRACFAVSALRLPSLALPPVSRAGCRFIVLFIIIAPPDVQCRGGWSARKFSLPGSRRISWSALSLGVILDISRTCHRAEMRCRQAMIPMVRHVMAVRAASANLQRGDADRARYQGYFCSSFRQPNWGLSGDIGPETAGDGIVHGGDWSGWIAIRFLRRLVHRGRRHPCMSLIA